MNNKSLLIISALLLYNWGCGKQDEVDRIFGQITERLPINYATPERQEMNRYKIYSLTSVQLAGILSNDFTDAGFSGWRDCTQNKTIGLKEPYRINVRDGQIKINSKQGADQFNSVDIDLNLKTRTLILHNGLTYGR